MTTNQLTKLRPAALALALGMVAAACTVGDAPPTDEATASKDEALNNNDQAAFTFFVRKGLTTFRRPASSATSIRSRA